MYKTDTKRVALRLLETDEDQAREDYQVPTGRLLNRALEVYICYLQHCTDEQLASKRALYCPDRRPGARRLYNFRLRRDLYDYIMMHKLTLSATIGAALDFYAAYCYYNCGERALLQSMTSTYSNTYINTDYIVLKARRG